MSKRKCRVKKGLLVCDLPEGHDQLEHEDHVILPVPVVFKVEAPPPPMPEHGTRARYVHGCRGCRPCREANNAYFRERRKQLTANHANGSE